MNVPSGAVAVRVEEEDDALEMLLVVAVVPDIVDIVDVVELLIVVEDLEEEDVIMLLLDAVQLPGRHCEYQGFEYVQQDAEAHVVGPVQSIPPPAIVISLESLNDRTHYIDPKPPAGHRCPGSGQLQTQQPSLY